MRLVALLCSADSWKSFFLRCIPCWCDVTTKVLPFVSLSNSGSLWSEVVDLCPQMLQLCSEVQRKEWFANKPSICLISPCVEQDSTRSSGIDEPWQHSKSSLKTSISCKKNITVKCFALCLWHLLTFLFCSYFKCFMNSILQCLSNTQELRDYCLMNCHRTDLNNNTTANTALMEGKCEINLKLPLQCRSAWNSHGGAKYQQLSFFFNPFPSPVTPRVCKADSEPVDFGR